MDINRVYSAHQIALIRAAAHPDEERREHLRDVADSIAGHISWYKTRYGAPRTGVIPAARLAIPD